MTEAAGDGFVRYLIEQEGSKVSDHDDLTWEEQRLLEQGGVPEWMDDDESRYWTQDMLDVNLHDLVDSAYAGRLECIIDEQVGGIIAYATPATADRIIEGLRAIEGQKDE